VAGELEGCGAGHADHSVLARGVGDDVRRAAQPRDRRGVHDRAAAPGAQQRRHDFHAEPDGLDVDGDHPVERLFRVVDQRLERPEDAGVVEEHVDAAEPVDGRLRVALDVGEPRHVGLDGERLAVGLLDGGDALAKIGRRDVDENHARALGREAHRRRRARCRRRRP
jgi:hypothetical protein